MTTKSNPIRGKVLRAGGVLDRIVEAKTSRIEQARRAKPLEAVIEEARSAAFRPRSLASALGRKSSANIIAEIKRRSPSRGVIRKDFDPARIADSYERAGAAAISVLAEEDFFGGSLHHLQVARERANVPLLRKDFIFDDYQLYESAVCGADAILLIAAILDDKLLAGLIELASDLGLDSLVEVHTRGEMERAARAGAKIIGVNNRDLSSFNVDLQTSLLLAPLAPAGAILVSESGIKTCDDISLLRSAGFDAFLVGEHLMRAADPGAALRLLIGGAVAAH